MRHRENRREMADINPIISIIATNVKDETIWLKGWEYEIKNKNENVAFTCSCW